jgi:hypothetical protein
MREAVHEVVAVWCHLLARVQSLSRETMMNGVDISPHPVQGETFCERHVFVCAGGAKRMGESR